MNLALFAAGVAITTGPWLVKNVCFTGNPVYPLAYNLFGGRDWTPALNAKFVPVHSPKDHRIADLGTKFIDVLADNDWSSALVFGSAPLAFLAHRGVDGFLWLCGCSWSISSSRIGRSRTASTAFGCRSAGSLRCWPACGAAWSKGRAWIVGGGAVDRPFALVQPGVCGWDGLLRAQRPPLRPRDGSPHRRGPASLHGLHE